MYIAEDLFFQYCVDLELKSSYCLVQSPHCKYSPVSLDDGCGFGYHLGGAGLPFQVS